MKYGFAENFERSDFMTIEITDEEKEFIISCIRMAKREGYYSYYKKPEERDQIAIPLLIKMGHSAEGAEDIIEGYEW